MACSNSGNDAHKDHLSSWKICKSLIRQRCCWRGCDELLTWVFRMKHPVEGVTSRADPGVRGLSRLFCSHEVWGEPGSGGSCFIHKSFTFIAAEQKLASDPKSCRWSRCSPLNFSSFSSLSEWGYFPPTFLCWTRTDISQVPGVAEGVLLHSRAKVLYFTFPLPAPGRDSMAAITFSLLCHPIQITQIQSPETLIE